MTPRPYWKGYLKLSLVSCPIRLFPAISQREKIRFHLINRKTGNRIKYCKLDAVTGKPVDDHDIIKAYEVGKGRFVEVGDAELESVAIASTHTIEIDRCVPRREIDELYWNIPYYITPESQAEAFAVIREALKKEGMVALGHVVFTTREHMIAVEPRGKGMLGVTLRYPYEIRNEAAYFDDIPDEKIPKDMIDLAAHIVDIKAGHFEPEKFQDRYESALKELIKKKLRGEKIETPKKHPPAQIINLMDALRQSAAAERGGARSRPRRAAPHQRASASGRQP
jgi:DNA end-binding protein Ku